MSDPPDIVRVRGHQVAYRRRSAAGPTLLLLHGAGGNLGSFDELWPHLEGLDAVAFALPGRTGSAGPPLRSIADVARWVVELSSALGLDDIVCVGHSMGGAVALELAVAGWSKLRGLCMVSSAAHFEVSGVLQRILGEGLRSGPGAARYPALWSSGAGIGLIARAERTLARTPLGVALCDWEMVDGFDRTAQLPDIRLPTLVVCGEHDLATPPSASLVLHEGIEGARLALIRDGGHMLPVEDPRTLSELLRSFLASF